MRIEMAWHKIAQKIKQTNYGLKHKLWPGSKAPKQHYKEWAESEAFAGMRVLHAGGGRNKHNLFHGQHVQRLNVDLDQATLAQDAAADVRLLGDLAQLPVQENTVDLIVCEMVFEHVENPERVVRELFRCLKEGGKIVFITPNLLSYPFLISKCTPFWFHRQGQPLRRRNPSALHRTLAWTDSGQSDLRGPGDPRRRLSDALSLEYRRGHPPLFWRGGLRAGAAQANRFFL